MTGIALERRRPGAVLWAGMYLDRGPLRDATYRKAGKKPDEGVEVGITENVIGLRDAKDWGRGQVLAFSEDEWKDFIDAAKRGDFDLPGWPPERDNWPFGPSPRR
jgi:hypothetical protein